MLVISDALKERFVRDNKIQIRLFDDPYFTERLYLYDSEFQTISKWSEFLTNVKKYSNDEEYFAEYNKTKDNAINFIKASEGYIRFNEKEDMNKFGLGSTNLPAKDVFKPSFIGKNFISIDMRKANFSCLKAYSADIFDYAETWEDFIKKFTTNTNIIKSKYIREVILGNCNPKRHITYEKYLMYQLLMKFIESNTFKLDIVEFFSNDEIVIDISDIINNKSAVDELLNKINIVCKEFIIPIRVEVFTLKGIRDEISNIIIGYIRELSDGTRDFKCLNNYNLPIVLRTIKNEEITEHDLVFKYEGVLAKFIEVPKITIV